ncbi:MAG: ATP-binding protein [Burkholderiaceae bacterium]|nr:ATP-binding protein [Burkholderiaceae bacterium]
MSIARKACEVSDAGSAHVAYCMHFLRACLWVLLTAFSLSVQANPDKDWIIERGLYIEPSPGSLTIQQAVTQDYQPFGVVLNRGLTPTVRWLRLLVQAPAHGQEQVVLRVGPHYIRHIQLFEEKDGVWSSRSAGDHFPVTQNTCADNTYCFPVTVHAGVNNYFYLRIDTINGFFLNTQVMQPDALSDLMVKQQRNLGLEAGVILAIVFWALIYYIRTRQSIVGVLFFSQIVTLLFTLSGAGILADLFFEQYIWLDNLAFNTLYIFRLMTSLWITSELLKQYEPPRWYSYYIKGLIAVLCLELLALKLDYLTMLALNFNFLIATLLPLVLVAALPWCRKMPAFHRWLIGGGVLLMGVLIWMDILPLLGWVHPNLVSLPGNWGGLIIAFILSIMVLSDVTQRRETYDREMQELQFMRARNQLETEQIKERSMLIDMLTHELKNPLATMRMAAGSLRSSLQTRTSEQSADSTDRIDSMIQAIGNMNTVIERCVQVDQLDQKGFAPKFENFDVGEVVRAMLASLPEAEVERIDLWMPSSSFMLRSDPNLFAIVLANLLDNATKYSQSGSRILLELFDDSSVTTYSSRFILRVSNTVGDNDAPDPDGLFTRYYRGPYAHDKSGTGLGLYLVKALCKIIGGTIRFDYKDHQVNFTVELKR